MGINGKEMIEKNLKYNSMNEYKVLLTPNGRTVTFTEYAKGKSMEQVIKRMKACKCTVIEIEQI